jgi:AAHS family 4-hydroxybenzoate transporter-like MFS transporter
MATAQSIDVSRIIDERKVSGFNIKLVIVSFLVVLLDGYDIAAIGFAAPDLIKAWNITDKSALGPVFGASLLGMLFGAPGFGYVGDRFGRKIATIHSCLIFGIFTWLAVLATSLQHLLILRFLAGIGIGGLLPNMIALNAEFAPKRFRATMVIVMFSGVAFGGGMPGLVSALLVPKYGWQVLFAVGGILPIAAAIACAFWLPESIKYLVVKGGRQAEVRAILARVEPGFSVDPNAQFVIQDEKKYAGFTPKYLFSDGLALITPLLWLLFVVNLMGYFFLISWTPTLLTSANVPVEKAAIATALFQIGGAVGGWVLCRPMDNRGLAPITVLFAIAVLVVGSIGYIGPISESLLMAALFLGGFCVLGLQFGLNATSAMIYPTSFRANGAGWALGVGRVGSIVGPVLGGVLISMKLPIQQLYLLAAVPFLIGTIACFVLARLYVARFQGSGLGQRDSRDASSAGGKRHVGT